MACNCIYIPTVVNKVCVYTIVNILLVGMIRVWCIEARPVHLILLHVMRRKIVKYKDTNTTGKFPVSGLHFSLCFLVQSKMVSYLFFFFFQVPLISCASAWRAGETKNDVSLNYLHC
jgi:hypothetical protein